MVKIKVCGVKSVSIANKVSILGADAIGFVFAPSKREVSLSQAIEISNNLRGNILRVGVFVNEDINKVLEYAAKARLDIIQLHGDEDNKYCEKIKLPIIKAFSIKEKEDINKAYQYNNLYGYLFDAKCEKYRGGEGKSFDWESLLTLPKYIRERLILAGGLSISNIKIAMDIVNPFMVDVSSGVETNNEKDPQLIKEFINLVKREG